MLREIFKARLEHDGAMSHLPFIFLRKQKQWKIGEKVEIRITRIVKKKKVKK